MSEILQSNNQAQELLNVPETMQVHLLHETQRLQAIIHDLSSPEREVTAQEYELIASLGQAAYHLARSAEQVATISIKAEIDARMQPQTSTVEVAVDVSTVTEESTESTVDEQPIDQSEPANVAEVPSEVETESVLSIADTASETEAENVKPLTQSAEQDDILEDRPKNLQLTQRESQMIALMRMNSKDGEWFKQAQLQLDNIGFSSEGARRQAYIKLTGKLIEFGLLEGTGKRGGRKYRFISNAQQVSEPQITPEEPESPPAPVVDLEKPNSGFFGPIISHDRSAPPPPPSPEIFITPAQRLLRAEATRFAGELVVGIDAMIDRNMGNSVRAATIVNTLSEALEISVPKASDLVNQLIEKDHYYYERINGSKNLEKGPKPDEAEREDVKLRQEEKKNPKLWANIDVIYAKNIFDILLEHDHVQQGTQPKEFLRRLHIAEEDEARFRQTLRKLQAAGYLAFNPKSNTNTRSEHSKKIYQPVYLIANQNMKDRLKKKRNEIIIELQALVDRDSSNDTIT